MRVTAVWGQNPGGSPTFRLARHRALRRAWVPGVQMGRCWASGQFLHVQIVSLALEILQRAVTKMENSLNYQIWAFNIIRHWKRPPSCMLLITKQVAKAVAGSISLYIALLQKLFEVISLEPLAVGDIEDFPVKC